jgi:hypothetical protein
VVEVLDLEMKNKKKGFGGSMEKLEFWLGVESKKMGLVAIGNWRCWIGEGYFCSLSLSPFFFFLGGGGLSTNNLHRKWILLGLFHVL